MLPLARFTSYDLFVFFFFNDPATTEIYTLSLHDALPISPPPSRCRRHGGRMRTASRGRGRAARSDAARSEEHTSELQSPCKLVCRLLLEKKKNNEILVIFRKKKKNIDH